MQSYSTVLGLNPKTLNPKVATLFQDFRCSRASHLGLKAFADGLESSRLIGPSSYTGVSDPIQS